MLDLILDFLFELVFDGIIYASTEKKVPLPLRILAILILVLFYGGLVGTLVYIGIKDRSWIIVAIAAFILAATILAVVKTYRRHN